MIIAHKAVIQFTQSTNTISMQNHIPSPVVICLFLLFFVLFALFPSVFCDTNVSCTSCVWVTFHTGNMREKIMLRAQRWDVTAIVIILTQSQLWQSACPRFSSHQAGEACHCWGYIILETMSLYSLPFFSVFIIIIIFQLSLFLDIQKWWDPIFGYQWGDIGNIQYLSVA